MNIHPLIVHFPIALLTAYVFLELIRRFTKQPYWFHVRAFLVIAGSIGAFLSLQTGELAKEAFGNGMHNVLQMHEQVARICTFLFAILSVAYGYRWLKETAFFGRVTATSRVVFSKIDTIERFLLDSFVTYILAVVGFSLLGLVGALGGILVYGPNMDPVTQIVYKMFF